MLDAGCWILDGGYCILMNGRDPSGWSVWSVSLVWFVWSACRAWFTPLNRVPFWKFNGAGGPHQWANHKLVEAVRPCFWDLVSKPVDGSKRSYKGGEKGLWKGLEL